MDKTLETFKNVVEDMAENIAKKLRNIDSLVAKSADTHTIHLMIDEMAIRSFYNGLYLSFEDDMISYDFSGMAADVILYYCSPMEIMDLYRVNGIKVGNGEIYKL